MNNCNSNIKTLKINEIISIPNVLSVIRIALIPFIVVFKVKSKELASSLFIILSALTDVVDGYIARRFNMTTSLGKALDPIADKLTLLSIIVCLCLDYPIMFLLLSIFIIKEIVMGVQGLVIIRKTGTTYSAKWYGKISTVLLYLTLFIHVLFSNVNYNFTIISVIVCIISILLSLTMYTILNVKKLSKFGFFTENKNF